MSSVDCTSPNSQALTRRIRKSSQCGFCARRCCSTGKEAKAATACTCRTTGLKVQFSALSTEGSTGLQYCVSPISWVCLRSNPSFGPRGGWSRGLISRRNPSHRGISPISALAPSSQGWPGPGLPLILPVVQVGQLELEQFTVVVTALAVKLASEHTAERAEKLPARLAENCLVPPPRAATSVCCCLTAMSAALTLGASQSLHCSDDCTRRCFQRRLWVNGRPRPGRSGPGPRQNSVSGGAQLNHPQASPSATNLNAAAVADPAAQNEAPPLPRPRRRP